MTKPAKPEPPREETLCSSVWMGGITERAEYAAAVDRYKETGSAEAHEASSLQDVGRRLADNWRRGYAAHLQLRREYRAGGEWSLWATSYVFAPMFWLLVAVFSIYATSKGHPESPTESSSAAELNCEDSPAG